MSTSTETPSRCAADAEAQTGHSETAETDTPELTVTGAAITMVITTTLVAFHADFIVGNVNFQAPKMFLGLIVIPIIGNFVEHWTAVVMAYKGKADLAIGIALESSIQIAALVLPIVVLFSAIPGVKSLSFVLDYFQASCLAVTILALLTFLPTGTIRKCYSNSKY